MSPKQHANSSESGNEWIDKLDFKAFGNEIKSLYKLLKSNQGIADVAHLRKIILVTDVFILLGFLTLGLSPSWIFPSILLSIALTARWTCIGHHVCHGGYNKCRDDGYFFGDSSAPTWIYTRGIFGIGWRRCIDWFDWFLPEAWDAEHNKKHHYFLGEDKDPDDVQRNTAMLREEGIFLRYLLLIVNIFTWKWGYYASNTFKELKLEEFAREGIDVKDFKDPVVLVPLIPGLESLSSFQVPSWYPKLEFLYRVMLPYILYRFVIFPLPWLLFSGRLAFHNALFNIFLAEAISNAHTFMIIVTNHAGEDMYRFDHSVAAYSPEFFVRAAISSVNYPYGNDFVDYFHGWLGYQIEHHMMPDLSMLSYQKAGPIVREICKRHGVPYIQENIFIRTKKTIDIILGHTVAKEFPSKLRKMK